MRSASLPALLCLWCCLALALPGRSLVAQGGTAPIGPGARVRVSSPVLGLDRQVAIVDTADATALVLLPAGRGSASGGAEADRLWVPLATVTRLETSRGLGGRSASRVVAGTVGGALVGTLIGGFVGYYASGGGKAHKQYGDGMGAIVGVPLGFAAGALIGGISGWRHRAEEWAPVALPPRRR